MISGLQGRVAFRAVNRFGKGVNFKALIVSSHNDTVARIQSHHLGMGSFIFTPKMDEKYYAQIEKDPDAKRFALPKALSQGYTFFVDNLTSKEKIKVMARNNLPEKDRPILIGQMRGQVIFQEQSEQAGNSFSWLLSRSEITESGVLQLTLFSSAGVPLCERVIYQKAQDKLQVSIQPDKKVYSPRGKVSLSIQVKNQDGEPVQGDFSLAAVDMGQVNIDETSQNISNYLLLTSDLQTLRKNGLRGEIEQPHHYFSKSDPKALINLDILLMTQGWRRFLWTDLLQKRTEKPAYIWESGISLSGKASVDKRKNRNKPIEITLSYFSKTDGLTFSTAKADAAGRFKFSGVDVMTKGTVYLQGHTDDAKDKVTITLDSLEFPIYNSSGTEVDPIVIDNNKLQLLSTQQSKFAERDAVFQFNKTKLLPEVMVKASKTNLRADSRRMLYRGTDFTTIKVTPELCSMYGTMFDMLRGRIPFLQVDKDARGNIVMSMRGQSSIRGAVPPAILVDGVQLDLSILLTISPCQVESLDYVRSIVMTTGTPGLISIMTKVYSGNEIVEPTPPGAAGSGFKITGFTAPREFYSPIYNTEESEDKKLHDFRSTLFWVPIIRTDASGNAQVTFWNSDEKTTVHVTLEGISSDGQPVHTTAEYTVE
jgi:hypothetical protein